MATLCSPECFDFTYSFNHIKVIYVHFNSLSIRTRNKFNLHSSGKFLRSCPVLLELDWCYFLQSLRRTRCLRGCILSYRRVLHTIASRLSSNCANRDALPSNCVLVRIWSKPFCVSSCSCSHRPIRVQEGPCESCCEGYGRHTRIRWSFRDALHPIFCFLWVSSISPTDSSSSSCYFLPKFLMASSLRFLKHRVKKFI